MAEQFANKISTTLAANYTAGSGTLTVADATGMPATGNFRIRLGNTAGSLLRVTARAGAVLTVDVEQDDGNAVIGDTVRLVNTAAAMLALKADAIAGVSSASFPGWPTVVPPPDTSAWTWQNQGGAVVQQSAAVLRFQIPTNAGESMRGLHTAAPATPYVITLGITPTPMLGANTCFIGFYWRESGTSKVLVFGISAASEGIAIRIRKMTNDTTFSAETLSSTFVSNAAVWLRASDDGVNTKFEYSFDGTNWITLLDQARGTFFTVGPNQIGVGGWNNASGATQGATVLSWAQS